MSRARWAALVAAFALLVPASAASAHGGNPNYRSIIDGVTPPVPNGVTIEVLDYDSYMQLFDQKGHEVMIYGYQGEPYARILKNGTVEVNQRSPATYLNDNRFATTQGAGQRRPEGAAGMEEGRRIRDLHLARPPHALHVGIAAAAGHRQEPENEDLRLRDPDLGRRAEGDIKGTLYWVGAAGTSKLPFIVAAIVIVLGGGALVLFLRAAARRRRRRRRRERRLRPERAGGGRQGRSGRNAEPIARPGSGLRGAPSTLALILGVLLAFPPARRRTPSSKGRPRRRARW